jgi:ABC-2 type transport system ATP-binding protein
MTSVAELAHVTKRFGATTALDDVSFAVAAGEVAALLGPNGAGKTTALMLLVGVRRPDHGTARVFGRDPRETASRREVGVMPQETAFPLTLRVGEIVDLVRAHYESSRPAGELLERFGLTALAGRQLGGLSVGERRRVAVALAFAGGPRLVVLDEPTAGLDLEARRAVWDAIRAHAGTGGTCLLTTHYLEEAEALATGIVLIDAGTIVESGSVASIKAAAGLTRVAYRSGDGRLQELLTPDAGETVAGLVRAGVRLVDLDVRPLKLEEAIAARGRR